MRVFLSHSSKQKLLARELIRRFPKGVEVWLDEKEISVGENILESIENAFSPDLVSVILLVDENSARSSWVAFEVGRCLELEAKFNHSILIPVVVDPGALSFPDFDGLKARNYISCYDFSEETLDSVARQIINAVISAASRRIAHFAFSAASNDEGNSDIELARLVRSAVYGFREDHPLSLDDLLKQLQRDHRSFSGSAALSKILRQLQKSGLLHGIYVDDDEIYLSSENVRDKIALNVDEKRSIGKRAARAITSGSSIAIDTGSTALAFASQLSRRLAARAVDDLDIFTTSLPVANILIDMLNDANLGDDAGLCRVNVIGGPCRPRSQGTVPDDEALDRYLPQHLDISVIGCNGIVRGKGIGNSTQRMMGFKRETIRRAQRALVLMEAQKFEINQKIVIAPFSADMEIFTGAITLGSSEIVREIIDKGVTVYEC